jgi:hypothetical protein
MEKFFTHNHDLKAVLKWVVGIFMGASSISYAYAFFMNKYNGDFAQHDVEIISYLLLINFLVNISPIYFAWRLYLKFKRYELAPLFMGWTNLLFCLTLLIIIFNLFITFAFGYAIAGAEKYSAPLGLNYFIMVLSRFNVFMASAIIILNKPKYFYGDILLSLLLVALAFSRAAFGVFFGLPLIFLIKYHREVMKYYKSNKVMFVLGLCLIVVMIGPIYEIRDSLRGFGTESKSIFEVFLIKLSGRLSSFSNSAIIIQNYPYFSLSLSGLDDYFMQRQILGGLISGSFIPQDYPELILFNLFNADDNVNAAFMTGVAGILYLSLTKGLGILILNLVTYLAGFYTIFFLASRIKSNYILELTLLSVLGLAMSGNASEVGTTVINYVVMLLTVSFFLLIRKYRL